MEFFKPEKVTTDAFLIVAPGGGYVFFRNAHVEDTAAMWLDIFWNWLYTAGVRTPHPSANEKGAKVRQGPRRAGSARDRPRSRRRASHAAHPANAQREITSLRPFHGDIIKT